MLRRMLPSLLVLTLLSVPALRAQDAPPPSARVADLAWLAGHWRGTLKNGATFETFYTDASGGTVLSVSKEHRGGRTLTFELELFHEKEGRLIYLPHPNGTRSAHPFPLLAFDAAARRAVFENKEHDFPQTFTFAREADDRLVITLSGPGRNGTTKEIRYELQRVP